MPSKPTPPRARRLLAFLLYAGCAGAAVLVLRPILSAESSPVVPKVAGSVPTVIESYGLPPGEWSVLSADRLGQIASRVRGEQPTVAKTAACPLLPPGVERIAERLDVAGRVTAFLTAPTERATFERHWTATGWTQTSIDGGVALRRGTERAFAWTFAARESDRVHLLVTVTDPQPLTEARP